MEESEFVEAESDTFDLVSEYQFYRNNACDGGDGDVSEEEEENKQKEGTNDQTP
jgi:hypothetical protein